MRLNSILLARGLRHTTASHMVVFLYSAPIFVALALHFKVESEKLKPLQWLGISVAFIGLALTFLYRGEQVLDKAAPNMLLGDFLHYLLQFLGRPQLLSFELQTLPGLRHHKRYYIN